MNAMTTTQVQEIDLDECCLNGPYLLSVLLLKAAVLAGSLLLALGSVAAHAAVINPTVSIVDQHMHFSGSGFSVASGPGVDFLDRRPRPLGNFTSNHSASQYIWDNDQPPFTWVSIAIEDTITTTLNSNEISIHAQSHYRLQRPSTGFYTPARLGVAYSFVVTFEVEFAPVTTELFFSGQWTQGVTKDLAIELQDSPTSEFIAFGNNGFIVEDASGRSSRPPEPLTVELQPGLYKLRFSGILMRRSDRWQS